MNNISTVNPNIFISIDGICSPVINEYFTKLNQGNFTAVADLFAEQAGLTPPFDKLVQGRQAIAQYLEKEYIGIKSYPERAEILKTGLVSQYQVTGSVDIKHIVFNLDWFFELDNSQQIINLEVKIAASLEDLLNFR